MPILYKDRVKEVASNKPNTSTAFNLPDSSPEGFQSFDAAYATGEMMECMATNGTAWESFIGTFTAGTPDILARTTLLASSTGSAIDWSSGGDVTVFVTPSAQSVNNFSNLVDSLIPGGRLTPTSGVPYQTTSQSNVTRIYYTPFVHNVIRLRSGSLWVSLEFTETFFDIGTRANTFPFDVFAYLNNGQIAFDLVQWAGNATRATELSYLDGVLVKPDDSSRLYLGTIGCVTTTTTDSSNIFNHYNRRWFRVASSTDSTVHTYTATSWRNWNNGTGLPLTVTVGQPTIVNTAAYCRFYSGIFQSTGIVGTFLAGNESGGTFRLCAVGSGVVTAGKRTQTFQEYGNGAAGNWAEAQHSITWEC